jgi:hypothetical protein
MVDHAGLESEMRSYPTQLPRVTTSCRRLADKSLHSNWPTGLGSRSKIPSHHLFIRSDDRPVRNLFLAALPFSHLPRGLSARDEFPGTRHDKLYSRSIGYRLRPPLLRALGVREMGRKREGGGDPDRVVANVTSHNSILRGRMEEKGEGSRWVWSDSFGYGRLLSRPAQSRSDQSPEKLDASDAGCSGMSCMCRERLGGGW